MNTFIHANKIVKRNAAANTRFAARLGEALAGVSINLLTSSRGRDQFQSDSYRMKIFLNFKFGTLMGLTLEARPAP